MAITWKNNASKELANTAAELWGAAITEHISDSGNSVWLAEQNGQPIILRFTDPTYRSFSQCVEEIQYIWHLYCCGLQVATHIPSQTGNAVEEVAVNTESMLASAFYVAPGTTPTPESADWNDTLFLEWGRTLGKMHAASRRFQPQTAPQRWLWHEEVFLAQASQLLPSNDRKSHKELEAILCWFAELPKNKENFGMTHGDFAPQNFHYHPQVGITTFDFGNCCYHWYISDIAISLMSFRNHPKRDHYRNLLLSGYREQSPLGSEAFFQWSWFFRLRTLYVYLSRLMKFGESPTEKEQEVLARLRRNVHEPFAW